MKQRRNIWTIAAAATLTAGLCGVASRALAATDAERCQAAKIKAGGKDVLDTSKCHEKALKAGLPLDDACFMRTSDRIAKAIANTV